MAFLLIYLFTTIWFTVLKRPLGYHIAQFELFWSYKAWLKGDAYIGKEIMANIAMFIPFGFLFSSLQRFRKPIVVTALATLFSLAIEGLQLLLMRGLFEWDDIVSNTLGAVIGITLLALVKKLTSEKYRALVITSIGTVFMISCGVVYLTGRSSAVVEADSTSREYCFQIDESEIADGEAELRGFAFLYEHPTGVPKLFLHSTETGESLSLKTDYGLPRNDVNDYFLCQSHNDPG